MTVLKCHKGLPGLLICQLETLLMYREKSNAVVHIMKLLLACPQAQDMCAFGGWVNLFEMHFANEYQPLIGMISWEEEAKEIHAEPLTEFSEWK